MVIDVDALEQAAVPLADSGAVVELLTGWLDAELADAGLEPVTSDTVTEEILERSSVAAALETFTVEFVAAAADPSPGGSIVDVSTILRPAVPEIGAALESAGVPTPEFRVSEVVAGLDPLVVRGAGADPHIGPKSPAAARLGTAAVLAIVVMVVAGWLAIASAEDRLTEARSLLNRVAVGALSFSILLKLGSWVLDPRGGRAPLSESASIVANSKWVFIAVLGLSAAAAGGVVWLVRRYLRRKGGSLQPGESPIRPGERQPIRS